jgi:signal peptidase II
MKKSLCNILPFALIPTVFALDFISKFWVMQIFQGGYLSTPLLPVFQIVNVWNHGVSFGLLGAQKLSPWIFAVFSILVSLGLFIWMMREKCLLHRFALGLIISGALGNAFDRLYYGAVFDFLSFFWGPYEWPAFNLADSAVVVGVGLLFMKSLSKTEKTEVHS